MSITSSKDDWVHVENKESGEEAHVKEQDEFTILKYQVSEKLALDFMQSNSDMHE